MAILLPKYKGFKQERQIGEYKILLPDAPDLRLIANKDLPQHKQKFIVTQMPAGLENMPEKDRESFESQEWERREKGYWFYNNGSLEYLTGLHYFYINWWKIDIGLPSFMDSDQDYFYVWDYVDKNPLARGLLSITNRRDGKTYRAVCSQYEKISRTPNSAGGIQSKNNPDAKIVFNKLTLGWRKLPYFFKPVDVGVSHPATKLEFMEPNTRDTKNQKKKYGLVLDSYIDYENAKEEAYDGTKQIFYVGDEIGKCLSFGTPVLMHNGSIKTAENVITGDVLMGDDSQPRDVLSVTTGTEMMYEIVPKKGVSWGCNESHILSLKICSTGVMKGYSKGDIVNISIKDYLTLTARQKQHLMLWKVGVEYKEKKHEIPPYLLGIWLGDGGHDASSIYKEDPEIKDYLEGYCSQYDNLHIAKVDKGFRVSTKMTVGIKGYDENNNLSMSFDKLKDVDRHYGVYSNTIISESIEKGVTWRGLNWVREDQPKNPFLTFLQTNNLCKNKHIPSEFLYDSRENRLELLAGLLDTDGHLRQEGNSRNYEITQKRKDLADQIHILAGGLGFGTSIKSKMATMRRGDGSVYRCEVWRVHIYGDLYLIPCKIKRKKATKVENKHINTRNPLRCGFKVEQKGMGDYYGFTITGNRLFLLGDYTVTHNTVEIDVDARHNIVKECVMDGTDIVGKLLYTTTVEEMEKKGGANCKKIWDKADITHLLPNGETQNGLLRYFKPAYKGLRGKDEKGVPFVNEYGQSDQERTKAYLERRRSAIIDRDLLVSERRKYPFDIYDCFINDSTKTFYDVLRIEQQVRYNETLPNINQVLRRGNFQWKDGIKDTEVEWMDNPDGKWLVSWLPPIDKRNKFVMKYGKKSPANCDLSNSGTDPYDNKLTADNRKSDAASYVHRRYDMHDPDNSGILVSEYLCRPKMPEIFWEDMIMQSYFYGHEMLVENNRIGTVNYFRMRGYYNYLMDRPGETEATFSKDKEQEKGIPMSGEEARMSLLYATESYISTKVGWCDEKDGMPAHMGKLYFNKLLQCWWDFDFGRKWTEFDAMVGAGLAILGSRKAMPKIIKSEPIQFFKTYKYNGNTPSSSRDY